MHRPAARYRGFISYSHSDKAAARRLLNRLQTYRLPRKATPDERRRLGKFFMDRESLPASGGLSEAIVTGLAETRSLIVLCSPSAATSKWVRLEIKTFLEINPHGQILAVILSGDPQERSGETACFPPELLADGHEPLAADFRKGADGPKLGFLKLAASLSGARLEALLQRDQTRSRRRVTAVTALAASITLGMVTLAAAAITARSEADARRAEAEGLVDFMITDLRQQLEPLGRLDALDGVAKEVLAYYGADDKALDCAATMRKARAFHVLNKVLANQFQFDAAEEPARSALELLRNNADDCTDIPRYQQGLSHAEAWAVNPAWRRAMKMKFDGATELDVAPELQRALAGYEKALVEANRIAAFPDQASMHADDAADAHILIGQAKFHLGDLEAANRAFLKACVLIEPWAEEVDDDDGNQRHDAQFTFASCIGWQADIAEQRSLYEEAISLRQTERDKYHALSGPEETRDWTAYRGYLGSRYALARLYIKINRLDDARLGLNSLQLDASRLLNNDPTNRRWIGFAENIENLLETSGISNQKEGDGDVKR